MSHWSNNLNLFIDKQNSCLEFEMFEYLYSNSKQVHRGYT